MKVILEIELINVHSSWTTKRLDSHLLYRISNGLSPFRELIKFLYDATSATDVKVKKLEVK